MPRRTRKVSSQGAAQDDTPAFVIRRDLSGGCNSRQHEQTIAENQAVLLQNILLETAGSRSNRPGSTRIDTSYPASVGKGVGLFGFDPGGSSFELLAVQLTNLRGWAGSGAFAAAYKSDLTSGLPTTLIKAGMYGQNDIVLVSNATDNVYSMYQDHSMHDLGDTTQSPPKTIALTYYGNRVWGLKNNGLYFSDAYPGSQGLGLVTTNGTITLTGVGTYFTHDMNIGDLINVTGETVRTIASITSDTSLTATVAFSTTGSGKTYNVRDYSNAFDRVTNVFRMPVGQEMALVNTRDQGIVAFGSDQIWSLLPSQIPDPTTDQPVKILDIGCVAPYTAVTVADDIMFLSPDGVRGLFRTQLDKLMTGQSFPLSYQLADQFDSLNWAAISGASAIFFDNKYFISVPTGEANYNNQVWVYYPSLSTSFYSSNNAGVAPASRCWVVYEGWNIARFAKMRVNGQERLYGIDSVTGRVYRLMSGTTDNGTAIEYEEIGRAEDFGEPLKAKKGGEFKIRAKGGNGTLVVSAQADGLGWTQLGTMDLVVVTGVIFPSGTGTITFPVHFGNTAEGTGIWHLDDAGIIDFKRVKFKIYCNTSAAAITILESMATAFVEEYLSE